MIIYLLEGGLGHEMACLSSHFRVSVLDLQQDWIYLSFRYPCIPHVDRQDGILHYGCCLDGGWNLSSHSNVRPSYSNCLNSSDSDIPIFNVSSLLENEGGIS